MPLSDRDLTLSRLVSPPARDPARNEGLRQLDVQRLDNTAKVVGRVSFRNGNLSVFCEPCRFWTKLGRDEDFPVEYRCGRCERIYEMEFVVYAEVVLDDTPEARD